MNQVIIVLKEIEETDEFKIRHLIFKYENYVFMDIPIIGITIKNKLK